MIFSKISTTSKGEAEFKKFLQSAKKVKGQHVTIGVHKDAGEYTDSGVTVAQVAAIHEFGAPNANIPQRSFIRSTLDQNQGKINKLREECLGDIAQGKMSLEASLGKMGFIIVEMIKNKIKSRIPPKLKPGTLKTHEKHASGDIPLIDSGLLLRSITYKVEK